MIFHNWWYSIVIGIWDGEFSRKDTVMVLANVEGGAHVDPKMSGNQATLKRQGLGWVMTNGSGDEVDLKNPAFATVRQIAYEFEETVREPLGHLLD